MRHLLRFPHFLHLAATVALLALVPGRIAVAAQPTQALIEDWRDADYAFSARMMATDLDDEVYVVGDTAVGDYLVIKKFSATGALLWQTTYDPAERLRGVWIAVDSERNPVVLASMVTGSIPAAGGSRSSNTNGVLLWACLRAPFRDARRSRSMRRPSMSRGACF